MTTVVMLTEDHPNGVLVDASKPLINIEDQGLTRGDGVFETMLAANRTVRKLDMHLSRLTNSARMLDLPAPNQNALTQAIELGLKEAAEGPQTVLGSEEHVVKIIISRGTAEEGAHSWITVAPAPQSTLEQRTNGVKALTLPRGHDPAEEGSYPWLLTGAKTLSYALNMAVLRYAKKQGADDVIFVTDDRRILEGATSSVIVARVNNGIKTLLTPEPNHGILPGTTQGAIFKAAQKNGWALGFGPLYPQDLYEADGVWLASSVRLLAPVTHLNGNPLRHNEEFTAELLDYLAQG